MNACSGYGCGSCPAKIGSEPCSEVYGQYELSAWTQDPQTLEVTLTGMKNKTVTDGAMTLRHTSADRLNGALSSEIQAI